MADSSTAPVHQVVSALRTLHQDPSPVAKETANAWLAEFQKSVSLFDYCIKQGVVAGRRGRGAMEKTAVVSKSLPKVALLALGGSGRQHTGQRIQDAVLTRKCYPKSGRDRFVDE